MLVSGALRRTNAAPAKAALGPAFTLSLPLCWWVLRFRWWQVFGRPPRRWCASLRTASTTMRALPSPYASDASAQHGNQTTPQAHVPPLARDVPRPGFHSEDSPAQSPSSPQRRRTPWELDWAPLPVHVVRKAVGNAADFGVAAANAQAAQSCSTSTVS